MCQVKMDILKRIFCNTEIKSALLHCLKEVTDELALF